MHAHGSHSSTPDPLADRTVDEVARQHVPTGKMQRMRVNGNAVELFGSNASGLRDLIEDLLTDHRPGVPVPYPADFVTDEAAADVG